MEEDRRHAGFLIWMPMYNGSEGKARLCRILGDEVGGIVLERVRLIWHQAIMSVKSNMCDLFRISTDRGVMLSDGKSHFSVDGKPVLHFVGTFMFREYTIMHLGWVAKILAPLDKICVPRCDIFSGMNGNMIYFCCMSKFLYYTNNGSWF